MKKSTKRFVISSEAVNSLGFRVRTSGIDLTDFNKNPLLLWMHQRPKGDRLDEVLPIGYWADLELKDGKITGVPMFDDTDPFAVKIYNKVENGTIKMASAGLKPFQFAESNGEKWLETSSLQEASMCDIGSNKESLASIALYNDENKLIKLSEFNQNFNSNKNDMKLIELSADSVLPLLKLKEDANAAEAHAAILNLVTLAETQKVNLATLETEKNRLQDKLDLAEGADQKNVLLALVNKAKEDRKITEDEVPHYIALGEKAFDATKALLDGKVAAPLVKDSLNTGDKKDASLVNLSWKELQDQNKLLTLKEQDFDCFKEKFKAEFKADYK